MAEIISEAKAVYVEMGCDKCGEGQMKPTGLQLMGGNFGQAFQHKCDRCGEMGDFPKNYPTIDFKKVEKKAAKKKAGKKTAAKK